MHAHHACGELVGGAVLELAHKHQPLAAGLAHQMLLNAGDGGLVVSAQAASRTRIGRSHVNKCQSRRGVHQGVQGGAWNEQ